MGTSEQDENERIRTIIIKEEKLVNKSDPNSISNVLKSDNKTESKEQEQPYTSKEKKIYLKKLKPEKHHKEKQYNKTSEKKLKQNDQFKGKSSSTSRISVLLTLSRMLLAARKSQKQKFNDCGFPPKISNGNYTVKITESLPKQHE